MKLIHNNKKLLSLFNLSDANVLKVYETNQPMEIGNLIYRYYLVRVVLFHHTAEMFFRIIISKDGNYRCATQIDGAMFFKHEYDIQ